MAGIVLNKKITTYTIEEILDQGLAGIELGTIFTYCTTLKRRFIFEFINSHRYQNFIFREDC